eukprot:TRINITY_DN5797_c0_g1_i6.p1 TRINITY_DN5797_c0_g1~~TRINITY_DN5797_c0_g1_i6.p1  ORF type:complete len:234 (+),score=43.41 TRINITY_DN5797_c0_g1_i6:247-948(+)
MKALDGEITKVREKEEIPPDRGRRRRSQEEQISLPQRSEMHLQSKETSLKTSKNGRLPDPLSMQRASEVLETQRQLERIEKTTRNSPANQLQEFNVLFKRLDSIKEREDQQPPGVNSDRAKDGYSYYRQQKMIDRERLLQSVNKHQAGSMHIGQQKEPLARSIDRTSDFLEKFHKSNEVLLHNIFLNERRLQSQVISSPAARNNEFDRPYRLGDDTPGQRVLSMAYRKNGINL